MIRASLLASLRRLAPQLRAAPVFKCRAAGVARYSTSRPALSFVPEPDFIVDPEEGDIDSEDVYIPYMEDEDQQTIYAKWMLDRERWNFRELSMETGASLMRIKAIITLMDIRYEMMRSFGLEVTIHPGDPEDEDGDVDPFITVEVPPVYEALHEMYLQDEDVDDNPDDQYLAELLEDYNEDAEEDEKTAMTVQELRTVLRNLDDHYRRMENLQAYEEEAEDNLDEMGEEDEVDTSFREVPTMGVHKDYFDNYFPKMLHDEEFEIEKRKLLKRVEEETKGYLERPPQFYEDNYQAEKSMPRPLPARADKAQRWKYAYKDLSAPGLKVKGDRYSPDFTPTTIRTRVGG